METAKIQVKLVQDGEWFRMEMINSPVPLYYSQLDNGSEDYEFWVEDIHKALLASKKDMELYASKYVIIT